MTYDEKLAEIRRLLAEAYEVALAIDSHAKSSEGAISIHYEPYFWWEDESEWSKPSGISIYSYVLGPHRNNYFKNIDDALREVRCWHKKTMKWRPDPNDPWGQPQKPEKWEAALRKYGYWDGE